MTKIAVIGGGTMGATFIRAVTNAGLVEMSDLTVCEIASDRRDWLTSEFNGISVTADQAEAVSDGDVIYLSV
ncbi:MAG: NAD(P)-binding domain-containing protein, partial [Chloroflexi bacterium]|nr:NAD(P)-binding domain-containing protein [Chloroflexota bacterium]